MKKTLIASAIAAATFSGSALAQTTASASELAARMDSMPTVYGNIQYAIAHDNFDGGPSSLEHFDNGSTLGVKHDHEIAPGITGFFKLELEGLAADDKDRESGLEDLDEAYIGVKGDSFGQVWVGSDDSTYERAVDEISQYYEVATLNIGADYTTGEGDLIQYMSPSFGGLSLWGAVQINGDGDDASLSDKGGDKSYPYQLAALYEMDALELAVAMDSNDGGSPSNENTYGLRASYDAGALRVTGEYHTTKDASDTYGVIGYYTIGANQFALSYEMNVADDPADTETSTVTLQALHNLSDHMYVYFEGYLGGGDEVYEYEDSLGNAAFTDERSIASVGAVYYF
ncbi:porin [Marinobacter sp. SS13-12]|uniref:porin n=1 Tax=Marinobacter sp. SS13-12 TaxID=3050451 RepID=UPI0025525683|nr:porin [Marinobacter sp. SS13-12]MDK8466034.1 porin [Marinobacter sp. SS13-12]